ncbi:MAG TPA: SIR2 family protein [Iamia sp.]
MASLLEPDLAGRDVLVLGAGFSRAASDDFPLTDELGNLVRDQLKELQPSRWLPQQRFENGSFEAWLTSIAEDQPDLSTGDNEERHALFTRSTELTRSILLDRQGAEPERLPNWLRRFIWLSHCQRSVVITFNYDTVVEDAVDAAGIDAGPDARVGRYDVLDHLPPRRFGLQPATEPHPTFDLLKLHGSVDWYWEPRDVTGATIAWSPDRRPPGLSPFLTPPAASKSSFYANPISRELWRRAGSALSETSRLAIVGYSLPASDLTVSGMLQRHLRVDDVEIVVVNPDPEPVSARLIALGFSRSGITEIGGGDAVASYVAQAEGDASRRLLDRLRSTPSLDRDAPLGLSGLLGYGRRVDEVRRGPDGPVLVLAENLSHLAMMGRADADPTTVTPGRTMRDLLDADERPDGTITALLPDGTLLTIVGHQARELGEIVRVHLLVPSNGPWAVGPMPPEN